MDDDSGSEAAFSGSGGEDGWEVPGTVSYTRRNLLFYGSSQLKCYCGWTKWPLWLAGLKLVVVVLTMLSVCVAVDVGVAMGGAVEQGSVGGTIIGGATCIIIREQ